MQTPPPVKSRAAHDRDAQKYVRQGRRLDGSSLRRSTADHREHEWAVPYSGNAVALEQAGPGMRLAATASGFSEWLVSSPYAAEITPDRLLGYLAGVPETYGADARPKKLEWMIRQAKSISGK